VFSHLIFFSPHISSSTSTLTFNPFSLSALSDPTLRIYLISFSCFFRERPRSCPEVKALFGGCTANSWCRPDSAPGVVAVVTAVGFLYTQVSFSVCEVSTAPSIRSVISTSREGQGD